MGASDFLSNMAEASKLPANIFKALIADQHMITFAIPCSNQPCAWLECYVGSVPAPLDFANCLCSRVTRILTDSVSPPCRRSCNRHAIDRRSRSGEVSGAGLRKISRHRERSWADDMLASSDNRLSRSFTLTHHQQKGWR